MIGNCGATDEDDSAAPGGDGGRSLDQLPGGPLADDGVSSSGEHPQTRVGSDPREVGGRDTRRASDRTAGVDGIDGTRPGKPVRARDRRVIRRERGPRRVPGDDKRPRNGFEVAQRDTHAAQHLRPNARGIGVHIGLVAGDDDGVAAPRQVPDPRAVVTGTLVSPSVQEDDDGNRTSRRGGTYDGNSAGAAAVDPPHGSA